MDKLLHCGRRYPAEARSTQQQFLWCGLSQATLTVISPRIKALSQYFTDLSKDFSLPHAAFLWKKCIFHLIAGVSIFHGSGTIQTEPVEFFFLSKGRTKPHKQHFAWGRSRSRSNCICRINQFYQIKCKTDKCNCSFTPTSLRSRFEKKNICLGATFHQKYVKARLPTAT